jgi:hypothetical protein|tara:strand:+ start:144 stop:383 length:240 start_codon:yes stop_codon:yes gene_type:complete
MNTEIITLLLLIIILGCICAERKLKKIENWEMYRQKPYGYVKTGSAPLAFYERPRYRKPYRYPFTFDQEYPTPHKSHLP